MPRQRENPVLPTLIPMEGNGVLRDAGKRIPCILRGLPRCRVILAPALSLQQPAKVWWFISRPFSHGGTRPTTQNPPSHGGEDEPGIRAPGWNGDQGTRAVMRIRSLVAMSSGSRAAVRERDGWSSRNHRRSGAEPAAGKFPGVHG